MTKPKIVIVGAGNVASHIAPALFFAGAGDIVQVCSRSLKSASALTSRIPGAVAAGSLDEKIGRAHV